MWCLSLLPNPNWAHLSVFLWAPRGRWSHHSHQIALPSIHIISSILWSFKVWDCEPEWEEPPFGVLGDPGAQTWGRTTRGSKDVTVAAVPCGQWCMDPLPRSPSEASWAGAVGGRQRWFSFLILIDIIFSPPVWQREALNNWYGAMSFTQGFPTSLSCHFPRIYFPDLKSLDHSAMHAYFQVQKFWLIWTLTEICIGKCIGAATCLEITEICILFSHVNLLSHKLSPRPCELGRVWIIMTFYSQEIRGSEVIVH